MLQPISHSAAKEGGNQREETWGGSKSPKGACRVIFFIITLWLTGEAFYLEVKWEKCLYFLTFDFICFILVSSFGSTMKFIVDIYIDSVIFKMYSLDINELAIIIKRIIIIVFVPCLTILKYYLLNIHKRTPACKGGFCRTVKFGSKKRTNDFLCISVYVCFYCIGSVCKHC